MYDLMMAMEVSRIVHEERLAAAQKHHLRHELELANRLEVNGPSLRQLRKMMNRVMSLFF
jgi:hypothetical protein